VRPYDHAPKTGVQNGGASNYPLEERRLFNDLLAQAVYAPEGIADSTEAQKRIEDFRGSDDLFIVYRDPVSEQLVPIFLRREDFMTLADAAPLLLNQAGLLAGPNYTDPKGPIIGATTQFADQVGRALADQYDAAQFQQNVHDLTAQLFDDMVGLLDASLQRRSDELEQRRLENEDKLRRKTAELAREIQDLEENWAAVQRRIRTAGEELRTKTTKAEKLFTVLQDRIAYIESLSMQGAGNWGEFVTQIVAVAKNLQIEADHLVQNAAQHIQATNEKFSQAHHDVVNPTLQRINELKQKLDGIGKAFDEQTDDLARTIERLAQGESILKGVHHPASDTAPDLMNDLIAAQQDVEQLRRQITEVETEAENQRRDLIRELNEERRKAAHVTSLEQELAEYREQGAKHEKELEARFQAHEEIASKLRNERQALRTQVHQASENEKELHAELERLTRDTEQAKSKLETELDMLQRLQHQVALNANNVDVPLNHKRFEEIALLADQMYFAEDMAQPNVAQGLVTIHNQICKSIESIFQVQRIPIELGKTLSDPNAGHNEVATRWDPQLPERVILKVVQDGYIHLGKIKREVKVVVNYPDNS
jgi:molecular chaperone GrpE (heat shock protein)